jgi:poly-gamma-glutamate synthesis protein (capsule biosynthesis protein)
MGELIVHKDVAIEVLDIFESLYALKYPIHKMRLVSEYKGNDWQSIEADNTSAFNCRNATGSKKWSKHSYGKAIDLNPIENPYISRKGRISHKASLKYRKRVHKSTSHADKAVLLKDDKIVKIFKSYGWKWGGDWSSIKDYQHFSK